MTSWSASPGLDMSDALPAAEKLVDDGRVLEAIDLLQQSNRDVRQGKVERRLVRLRSNGFAHVDDSAAPRSWPPPVSSGISAADGVPIVEPNELNLDALRAGIFQHGSLLVRGLVPQRRVDRLVEGMERAFHAYEAHAAGAPPSETSPWFVPFAPGPGYSANLKRKWAWDAAGVLVPDSPRVMYDLVETLEEAGLARLLAAHFGERPALSMYKSTLRRVPAGLKEADWHQDGAFLGEDIRVVNVWLCLSECGRDAPGLDIVARRFDGLVESGTGGAHFKWSVGPGLVQRLYGEDVVRPIFKPGDVLLFDQFFLHRTATEPDMTRDRYAIETWFFAPSAYPPEGLENRAQVGIPFVF